MKRAISIACSLAIVAAPMSPALAQAPFSKALKEKYEYKSVSCYACHMRTSEIPEDKLEEFKELSTNEKKAYRNAFGEALEAQLKGKDVTKRLAEVKELETDDPKKVEVTDAVTKEFLDALTKVEAEKSADGATYGALLKKAVTEEDVISGIKPKPAE